MKKFAAYAKAHKAAVVRRSFIALGTVGAIVLIAMTVSGKFGDNDSSIETLDAELVTS